MIERQERKRRFEESDAKENAERLRNKEIQRQTQQSREDEAKKAQKQILDLRTTVNNVNDKWNEYHDINVKNGNISPINLSPVFNLLGRFGGLFFLDYFVRVLLTSFRICRFDATNADRHASDE